MELVIGFYSSNFIYFSIIICIKIIKLLNMYVSVIVVESFCCL